MIYTSNQGKIAVSVPGVTLDNKSWDKFEGAMRSADTQNYPPGGMQPSIATGGVTKRSSATIQRAWDDTLIGAFISLEDAINGPFSCTFTPMQNATTTAAANFTYTGILKEVNRPNYDSTSSTIAQLELVVELNEPIG